MDEITLRDLLKMTSIPTDPEKIAEFHKLRQEAFQVANEVYADREKSYNFDHQPIEEMVFGPVSLAGELFKRARRMCGLLSPIRPIPLRSADLNRMVDLSIDMMNYSSWFYAQIKQAISEAGNKNADDAPNYLKEPKR